MWRIQGSKIPEHLVPYKRDGHVDTFVSSDRTGCSHLCFGRDGRNSNSRSTCITKNEPCARVQEDIVYMLN